MIESKLTQFLIVQAKADQTRHSGRSLFDHLVGTHDLLQRWGNREEVCDAGLFHSIYGTNAFRRQCWPLNRRANIANLIGSEAETLVYLFCTSNRPHDFIFPDDILAMMPEATLRALREIEAANLIEQGSKGRWLAMLRASDISDAAKSAIDTHLAAADKH
jgi:hypothetical protein